MRKLAIAYGNSRQAKKWVNKEITFDALKDRLKTPIRTTESAEEYAKFSKGQKDIAKDHGGFVAGVLKGGRRKNDTVELRSMIALDGDRINKEFLENYESNAEYTSVLYSTHSSTITFQIPVSYGNPPDSCKFGVLVLISSKTRAPIISYTSVTEDEYRLSSVAGADTVRHS